MCFFQAFDSCSQRGTGSVPVQTGTERNILFSMSGPIAGSTFLVYPVGGGDDGSDAFETEPGVRDVGVPGLGSGGASVVPARCVAGERGCGRAGLGAASDGRRHAPAARRRHSPRPRRLRPGPAEYGSPTETQTRAEIPANLAFTLRSPKRI